MLRRKPKIDPQGIARLQGERLRLRPPTMADAEAVYDYARDPEVTRYLAWAQHRRLADSERFLEQAVQEWRRGGSLVWLIEDASGVVGSIGARLSAANAGIGYVLARACWGRGYATEALQLLSEALLRPGRIQALWAVCVIENRASARVLEKGGFLCARTLDRYFSSPNDNDEWKDVFLYRRTKGDQGTFI